MTDPASLKRARAEFSSCSSSSKMDSLTYENCADLTYLGYVIQESLRLNPPASGTSMYHFDKDTQLSKKLRLKAYDFIMVNNLGLHMNANQWQRPFEFQPDRFDISHPLSRTPNGGKRHSFAWAPFSGGKRICFGKTFAENVLKITTTMMI